jgi:hypothetical protein
VLLVGAIEPEVRPWLRAAGHAARAVPGVKLARAALDDAPADLVVADRDRTGGLDVAGVCAALRDDPRLEDAWILAITGSARGGPPTPLSPPAQTTTCSARSPAASSSPVRGSACARPSSGPTTP